MKKILVIAYKFPPYNLVGSNRWSNLALNLAELGHEVHIITTKWKLNSTVPSHKNLYIHKVDFLYPYNLKYIQIKNRILLTGRKILFKLLIDPIFSINTIDEASNWTKRISPTCENIIKTKNITTIIATGAPFSVNYFASKLKLIYPKVKLIQDFRDPWSNNPHSKKAHVFKQKEYFALKYSDALISVTKNLVKDFTTLHPVRKSLIIQNGFNKSQIEAVKSEVSSKEKNNEKILITHIGNITNGREHALKKLFECVSSSSLKDKFKFQLVGELNKSSKKITKRFKNLDIILSDRLSQTDALKLVAMSDYALQLNEPQGQSLVSTKIYEYAGLGVPTLSINFGGEITDLIKDNQLGISLNLLECNLLHELSVLPKNLKLKPQTSELSFQYQSKNLSHFIENELY